MQTDSVHPCMSGRSPIRGPLRAAPAQEPLMAGDGARAGGGQGQVSTCHDEVGAAQRQSHRQRT